MSQDRTEYYRRYRDVHREKKRAQWRKASAIAKAKNPDAHRKKQNKARNKVRFQVLELLGGVRCARCAFSDYRALQIDHINGDGAIDRRSSWKVTSGLIWKLRKWIVENPELARAKYQVLCANCNWIKRTEDKECRKVRLH